MQRGNLLRCCFRFDAVIEEEPPPLLSLLLSLPESPSTLVVGWRQSGLFCKQTGLAVAHHPLAILFCAAVPAIERGYVLLQTGAIPRLRLAVLEAMVTLWRILLCVVALWVALSTEEWQRFSQHVCVMQSWELALQHLGSHLGHHLRVVLWEYALFLAAFVLVNVAVSAMVRSMAETGNGWLWPQDHRRAVISVLRNLIVVPLAVIYLVETLRPMFG
jgi:hypothetical protein